MDGPADHVHLRGLLVAWSEVNPAHHGQPVHREFERRILRVSAPLPEGIALACYAPLEDGGNAGVAILDHPGESAASDSVL